jgi:hypothetical protein
MADDFSTPVKKALADRVGHLCSNLECRALTTGPQDDPGKAVNLGVAAHITAASIGGPRYDPDLVPEERSSASPLSCRWRVTLRWSIPPLIVDAEKLVTVLDLLFPQGR